MKPHGGGKAELRIAAGPRGNPGPAQTHTGSPSAAEYASPISNRSPRTPIDGTKKSEESVKDDGSTGSGAVMNSSSAFVTTCEETPRESTNELTPTGRLDASRTGACRSACRELIR